MSKREMTLTKYVATFIALLALTALTFGLSFVPLGPWEWPLSLTIAAAKGALVALFFMHLIELSPAHSLAGVAAVVLLAILILFAMSDVWTRPLEAGPEVPQSTASG